MAGCEDDSTGPVEAEEQCGPFGPWSESDFVLPYPPDERYEVNQANCSGFGHSGFWKHGYDFIISPGDVIEAGETIGRSGVTGNTGGLPHLHFSVHPCNELPGLPNAGDCPSVPANFANTDPNPEGLVARRFYRALPF